MESLILGYMRFARTPLTLRHFLLISFLLLAPAAPLCPAIAFAEQRGPVERVVQGKVTNQDGKALSDAVVYLKDTRSNDIKSFIAANDGSYRFGQLSASVDYKIWAEAEGKKSPVKSVSSFDSKNMFNIDLKINTAK